MKKLWTILTALWFIPCSWATTYSFTGANYDTFTNHTTNAAGSVADFTSSMRVSGSFTTATPLAANLPGTNVASQITAYSFTDGLTTYASTDVNTYGGTFTVATDATGAVTLALINVGQWQAGPHTTSGRINRFSILATGMTLAYNNNPCAAAPTTATCTNGVATDSNSSTAQSPATANAWTTTPDAVTTVPTLSEWGMIILSSLLALGTLVTMRRRQG